jgi:phospholipase/lecithinase/hemolysin
VFGDSLSDNGNSRALFQVPPPPYFDGRWTNGPNWLDYFPYVANVFGVHVHPARAYFEKHKGTNFAVGGAQSGDLLETRVSDDFGFKDLHFPAQIPAYLATTGGQASANDLYVFWIGANDFSAGINPADTVTNIVKGIDLLRVNGARSFVVITVPDIWLTPDIKAAGGAIIEAAKEFVAFVNTSLQVQIPSYAPSHGINVSLVDINTIVYQLVYNPTKFGFANSIDAAYNPTLPVSLSPPLNPVADPDNYVFWDGFHPTTRAHFIAALFISRSITSRSAFPKRFVPLAGGVFHH